MNKERLVKGLVIAVVALVAVWWFTEPSQSDERIVYHTQPLSLGDIESTVNSSGTISPVVTVLVGSELSGLISQLNADFNDEVSSGQVIARIDDRTILSRLRQSEADLASSKASLTQLKAALKKAQTEATLAQREFNRTKELKDKNLVSASELDISETNNALAKVAIETAQAAILVGEAQVEQSQSNLEQTKLDLDRTYIRSPVDGVVIDRQVDTGQTVSASLSAPTLFSIAQDLVKMQIEADVDEADIGRIAKDQKVNFTVDAFPERKFAGVVSQVRKAATVTNNVVTYKVIISVENEQLLLLPGMTANVDVILGERKNVLRVPNSALRFTPEGTTSNTDSGKGGAGDSVAQLAQQLGLNDSQQAQVATVMENMRDAMQAARKSSPRGGPGGSPNDAIKKIRSKMNIELQSILTPDQMAQFKAQGQTRNAQRKAGDGDLQPGTVWVLRDGEPSKVNVGIGIADLEYSEIRARDLQAGDEVIVRAQKVAE
ncbi:efflux transporter, RND family, MFP subunit [Paraglaciecola sp. T6c]|uniref:efflux RND transporter periplasmic adaptor subunit n=1 Tax=Pseudoalteromonas atlantica (strain T6c / ATCC BAA-1087) TaxID=3042615 RepID=UPI00005C54D7|nr:efflux RND transporter periplasmic adaptor subunit [Paraglaciecola sp. T6c]ABG41288.1 efflux transporter, RND family, MFP subunit [Paraglaciecola sp. T6c]